MHWLGKMLIELVGETASSFSERKAHMGMSYLADYRITTRLNVYQIIMNLTHLLDF